MGCDLQNMSIAASTATYKSRSSTRTTTEDERANMRTSKELSLSFNNGIEAFILCFLCSLFHIPIEIKVPRRQGNPETTPIELIMFPYLDDANQIQMMDWGSLRKSMETQVLFELNGTTIARDTFVKRVRKRTMDFIANELKMMMVAIGLCEYEESRKASPNSNRKNIVLKSFTYDGFFYSKETMNALGITWWKQIVQLGRMKAGKEMKFSLLEIVQENLWLSFYSFMRNHEFVIVDGIDPVWTVYGHYVKGKFVGYTYSNGETYVHHQQ